MKNILFFLLIFCISSIGLLAQNNNPILPQHEWYKNKSFLSKDLTIDNFFQKHQKKMGLSEQDIMKPYQSFTDKNSISHHRHHQYHNGIRVYGETYILHEKEGYIYRSTGRYAPNIQLKNDYKVDENLAVQHAKEYFYNVHQSPNKIQNIDLAVIKNIEEVIVDFRFPESTGIYKLAYSITLEDQENHLKQEEILIDRSNGNMIFRQPLILTHTVPSTGLTRIYGIQSFASDSISPNYFILRDSERNITTYNGTAPTTFSNNSNYWELPLSNQHAIDAQYGTTVFYDMMLDSFNWSGIDGNGGAMNPVVNIHNQSDFTDAYWDGNFANFGNGDCHHAPLTTLEIIGHEFMHGITDHTSNLVYSSESGALNESLSDIFGKAVEFYYDNEHFSWEIGPKAITPFGIKFRSMSDPNTKGNPKFYKGAYWKDGANVHYNSGVLNYWFYLMVEGGTHTNQEEETYDITPIQMSKVLQILFNCQTSYLIESSNYMAMYEASEIVAKELYGVDSEVYNSLIKSWGMVGFPNTFPNLIKDLSIKVQLDMPTLCSTQEFFDVNILLSNTGTATIPMGEILPIILQYNDSIATKEIVLTEDLLPGEDLLHSFPDLIITDPERPTILLLTRLNYEDDSSSNNFNVVTQQILFYTEAEINIHGVQISRADCFDPALNLSLRIQNISCVTLLQGQTLNFTLFITGEPITFTHTLDRDYTPTEMFFIQKVIPDTYTDETINYNIEFTTSPDQNTENNHKTGTIATKGTLKKDYLYTFDDNSHKNDFFKFSDYEYPTHHYDGENYLATTTLYPPFIKGSCPDIEENFKTFTPNILTCIDLNDYNNPYLEFDMIQFRNNETAAAHPDLSQNTSVLKVRIFSSSQSIEEYYYDQTEGETVHHILPLPPNFVGKLEISTYNQDGHLDSIAKSIELYDVILLDNLKIGNDIMIGTPTSPSIESDIFLFPNPTSNILSIKTKKMIKSATLFNTQGVLLQKIINPEGFSINISDLPPALYFMKFELKNGEMVTRKFVKQ